MGEGKLSCSILDKSSVHKVLKKVIINLLVNSGFNIQEQSLNVPLPNYEGYNITLYIN